MADETTDEKTTEEAKPGTDEGSGTAETSTETTTETAGGESGGSGEDTAAELERLRAQLAEVAPIVQAHKDAEEARKTEEQKLREALESAERERDEASGCLCAVRLPTRPGYLPLSLICSRVPLRTSYLRQPTRLSATPRGVLVLVRPRRLAAARTP
ncbi:hypothetical protein [Streptomyces reniochalinae]